MCCEGVESYGKRASMLERRASDSARDPLRNDSLAWTCNVLVAATLDDLMMNLACT